jgi:hypothetical protein
VMTRWSKRDLTGQVLRQVPKEAVKSGKLLSFQQF